MPRRSRHAPRWCTLTHVINWVGQILPARAISDMAHARGCQVIVDGAHFLQPFRVRHSRHRRRLPSPPRCTSGWARPSAAACSTSGKEKVKTIWPPLGDDNPASENIRKFENLGTRSNASEMAIGNAVDFMSAIGIRRKEARLRYLKDYWGGPGGEDPQGPVPHVFPCRSTSCGIASFSVDGWNGGEICDALFEKKKDLRHARRPVREAQLRPLGLAQPLQLDLGSSTAWRSVDGIAEIAQASPPKR